MIAISIIYFTGCSSDESLGLSPHQNEIVQNYQRGSVNDPVGEEVVLGEKLQNPYAVTTMRAALTYYNNRFTNSPFLTKRIEATHQYVKINPATEFDLVALEQIELHSDDIVLLEYPLDYEVLQEGSEYKDPTYNGPQQYQPLYSVIPVGFELDIPYEVLEDLYQPKNEENDIETIALAMCNWQDDLIADYGHEVTMLNVNLHLDGPGAATLLYSRKFNPAGFVRMHTYDVGNTEGLKYAKLKIGRGVWWNTGYTDNEGLFYSASTYRGKVRIRSAWRNLTATLRMTRSEMIGVDVSDHIMTLTSSHNWTFYEIYNEGIDERLWCKGAIHNGTIKYYHFGIANGIFPVLDANIWVWKNGEGNASTPMLKQYPALPLMANLNGWSMSNFWSALIQHVGTDVYFSNALMLPQHLLPDQIYTKIRDMGTTTLPQSNRVVEQLVFHESGHFSHALKCGSSSYSLLFAAEIKNTIEHSGDPYHQGQSPTIAAGQQIALFEGWATFVENKCMQYHYGNICYDQQLQQVLPDYMEEFRMFTVPYVLNQRTDARSWFLSGLLWDLDDDHPNETNASLNSGSGVYLNQIVDRVYLNSIPGAIYDKLTGDVYNATDLKYKLLESYFDQAQSINYLFSSYGY